MLQIGASLREARERRGLELAEVERETRVRARYLRALEEERFDQLPPAGYRRTFLRGYANRTCILILSRGGSQSDSSTRPP